MYSLVYFLSMITSFFSSSFTYIYSKLYRENNLRVKHFLRTPKDWIFLKRYQSVKKYVMYFYHLLNALLLGTSGNKLTLLGSKYVSMVMGSKKHFTTLILFVLNISSALFGKLFHVLSFTFFF